MRKNIKRDRHFFGVEFRNDFATTRRSGRRRKSAQHMYKQMIIATSEDEINSSSHSVPLSGAALRLSAATQVGSFRNCAIFIALHPDLCGIICREFVAVFSSLSLSIAVSFCDGQPLSDVHTLNRHKSIGNSSALGQHRAVHSNSQLIVKPKVSTISIKANRIFPFAFCLF